MPLSRNSCALRNRTSPQDGARTVLCMDHLCDPMPAHSSKICKWRGPCWPQPPRVSGGMCSHAHAQTRSSSLITDHRRDSSGWDDCSGTSALLSIPVLCNPSFPSHSEICQSSLQQVLGLDFVALDGPIWEGSSVDGCQLHDES
jgi:hypothetical protein